MDPSPCPVAHTLVGEAEKMGSTSHVCATSAGDRAQRRSIHVREREHLHTVWPKKGTLAETSEELNEKAMWIFRAPAFQAETANRKIPNRGHGWNVPERARKPVWLEERQQGEGAQWERRSEPKQGQVTHSPRSR